MARIDSKPKAILEAVQRRLIASGAFTSDNCEIGNHLADWEATPGEAWATIWIEGGAFDPEQIDGGVPTITATITVGVHTRLLLDEAGRDDRTLTEKTSGLLVLVDKVFQSLWMHDLLNEAGDAVLREPMRPLAMGGPVRESGQWASIVGQWEVMFDWKVDE